MSARSRGTNDDLNLSLTGSSVLSSVRKSASAKQLHRPNSVSDIRTGKSDLGKAAPVNKKKLTQGARDEKSARSSQLSGRSQTSDVSSVSKMSNRKGKSPSDDFLALFESSMQPKIKAPAAKTMKKPTPNAVQVMWKGTPKKPASSGKKTNGHDDQLDFDGLLSPGGDQNFFQPTSVRSSSDESQDDDILSSSLRKIQGLQQQHQKKQQQQIDTSLVSDLLTSNKSSNNSISQSRTYNGIANNMIIPGKPNKTKASLSSIENSYQNIKHKTPVNQVKEGLSNQIGRNIAEDYIQSLNSAAITIQRFYRRHRTRKRAGEAAIKRMLQQKKKDREENMSLDLQFLDEGEKRSEDRKKLREEKARQARQQAIQELQKKREEKREDVKKKAEEEIAFLQASGKITKTPLKANIGRKKSPTKSANKLQKDSNIVKDSVSDVILLSNRTTNSADHHNHNNTQDEEDIFESASNVHPVDTGRSSDDRTLTGCEQTHPASEAATKSTLNDLLETLKKLEEEEHLVTPKPERKNAWLDDLDKDLESDKAGTEATHLTAERLQKLNEPSVNKDAGAVNKSGYLTDDKLQSIMSFLDEVQVADRISEVEQEIQKISENFENPPPLVPSVDELAEIEQAQAAANEVTNTVLSQRLELDEKKRTVTMLQRALNQQRELTVRHAKETEKEMKKRLDVQKDEYEETIKRHLSFIDQLIDDKKSLSERCEQLVKELKTVDKKYQDRIKTLEERNSMDIQKLKDMHEAAEKLRREKWIEDKTKKIKEMTVKGLEPEIQRLIAKHKGELKKIKQIHEAELLESDERAAQRYVKMTEDLRDQLAKEKEAACARERELAKQRYEKELQNEEEAYQQQRRRLYTEVQEEKERVAQQASRQRQEIDKLQRQLEDSHRQALSAMKSEFEKAREEQENRHAIETTELKEKLKLEKESWEENYMKKKETWMLQKERELKEQVRRDRDKEIELVITRLEEDATTSREECERAAENKIKRIREKFDTEMRDMERSERQALERYNEMKAKLTEVEGENECLKVQLRQKDTEIDDLKKLTDKMHQERDRVSDIIRQEFADRIVSTEEENKRIKNEMSEMKARHRLEIDRCKEQMEEVKKQKDEEMEEVHKRVKLAIVKKEEVVNQLRQQYQASQKRADHLEGLLQQQRKQLLGKT